MKLTKVIVLSSFILMATVVAVGSAYACGGGEYSKDKAISEAVQ